jgi:hypothetical protein
VHGVSTRTRRLDTALAPMLVSAVLATAFVVLRWLHAAQHQLGRFVVAGSLYANARHTPKSLPVGTGSGYDGEFYYRLALDPFDLAHRAFGISFDSYSRTERMLYPFLAWVVSGGHHSDVPLALVIVNVFAASMLGLAGGLLAKSAGRHAIWGLVFSGYWGYLWTLGRDLTELTTAALVIFALAALLRDRPIWAGLAFLGAVVSKETAVLLVGTLAVSTVWVRARQRSQPVLAMNQTSPGGASGWRPRTSDLSFVIPLVGFVLWQIVLTVATGRLPIYKSGGENLGVPLVGLVHGISHYLSALPSHASAYWFGELIVLAVLAFSALVSLRYVPLELRFLFGIAVLLILSTATGIWLGDVGFRSLDDLYLLSWVVLLFQPRRLAPWAAICVITWGVVVVELVRAI